MSDEPKKIELDFENGKAIAALDLDLDGEKSVEVEVNVTEGLQEIIGAISNKQKVTIPMPKFDWGIDGTSAWCSVDLDQDSIPCVKAKLNVGELISETIRGWFKK